MRKPYNLILAIALGGLVALAGAGCKKQASAESTLPKFSNVAVDLPKLRTTFDNPSPDVAKALTKVNYTIRYGRYLDTLTALDGIKALPDVTDAQKKVIDEVMEQVKQAAQNQEAAKAAQPAQ
jgi:hypothetical protein